MDREECITKEKTDLLFSLKQIDKKVYACKSCDKLVEKFPNSPTVFLGKDNDIVLVGEAPANNGWRKSHQLWKDVNGKILSIYHPSPISLKSYAGNMPIFDNLRDI